MQRLGNETALIFVINQKYLRPIKVLFYSLMKQNSLQGCDIIIVTDDRIVERDRFLRRIAKTIEFYDEASLSVFSTIIGDKIPEKSRVAFAPKYTFFKFVGFKPRGYKRHVVIDADMLCLHPLDEEMLALPYSAKAMFEVKGPRFPIREEPVTNRRYSEKAAIAYLEQRSLAVPNPARIEKVNSGFVVLQDDAISDVVFERAITIASTDAFGQEQAATTKVLESLESFLRLPMWYNTRRRVFESLGQGLYEAYADRMFLLHFTPGKPWIRAKADHDYLDRIWWDVADEGQEWISDLENSA